jgi:DNA-binding NarL/FixJ family response regulator
VGRLTRDRAADDASDGSPAFTQRQPAPFRPFTPRQLEIADGIGHGLTYAQIGAALGIAASTVRQQVHQMGESLADMEGFSGRMRVFVYAQWTAWDKARSRG